MRFIKKLVKKDKSFSRPSRREIELTEFGCEVSQSAQHFYMGL